MTRLLVLVLGGCMASQPAPAPSPYPTHDQMMAAGCEANVRQMQATFCSQRLNPLPSGWAESARRGLESQRAACPAEVLAPYETCVQELEAVATAQDPDAKQRREAARPKALATRQDPAFKQLIERWLAALDGTKIMCKQRDASASHGRECERWKADLGKVEIELRAYLQRRGFDPRDVSELGLWPSDPDGLGG